MALYGVEIRGVSALLQHRFTEQAEVGGKKATRAVLVQEEDPRAVAERAAYRDDKSGNFYFPGAAIARMLREAGGSHKMKGSRKAVKWIVPAAVIVPDDGITICNGNGTPAKDFEVDSRPVTIPATKGRIMRHRPRWDCWSAKFNLEIDEEVLPAEVIHTLLTEGGKRIGIGDYRPEKGGPFGRFQVDEWKKIEN